MKIQKSRMVGLTQPRSGFSFVELLVVLFIVTLLMGLLFPALLQVREASRKNQCRNNLRNLALAVTSFDTTFRRLPASGYNYDPQTPTGGGPHHNWVVDLLPYLDQKNLWEKWDFNKLYAAPENLALAKSFLPVLVCPVDITASRTKATGSTEKGGDMSYVVNGGVGFTFRTGAGVGDCPMHPSGPRLDLNGDGSTCQGTISDDADRTLFKHLGVFFLENWKEGGTVRHLSLADMKDGTSQTFLVTENIRVGFDPAKPTSTFATPDPYLTAFYLGLPCKGGSCLAGAVDYQMANAGAYRINSGLLRPEGQSQAPNSFHEGGVNMAYADGHVGFLSDRVDGGVYAALTSPRGMDLSDILKQPIVSDF